MDPVEPSSFRTICVQIMWYAIFAPVCVAVLWLVWDLTRYLVRRINPEDEESQSPDVGHPS